MRIFLGIVAVLFGFLMAWKTEWFLRIFGRMDFAEGGLSMFGGSRLMLKLVAFVIIFLGFLAITNLLSPLIEGIFRGLFQRNIPGQAF